MVESSSCLMHPEKNNGDDDDVYEETMEIGGEKEDEIWEKKCEEFWREKCENEKKINGSYELFYRNDLYIHS